ncbi:MAG TPA: response regulator transcription factor [Blastocatellia bacterium]|nr:response regulator transcription factor [Blastocatellia bacterium]
MNKLKIFLVEDHGVVREGLRAIIEAQPDMEVVGEAANGREAVLEGPRLSPDVVVMDISMPGMNGLEATKKLKEICPDAKVLTLTRHHDIASIKQLLAAGAAGYLSKQSSSTELTRAIRVVAEGNSYLDPTVTEKVTSAYVGRTPGTGVGPQVKLSEREQEVLRSIAWGFSNKEISAKLDISVKTVEAHKANSMRKLVLSSRIDIVRYALLQGWLNDN